MEKQQPDMEGGGEVEGVWLQGGVPWPAAVQHPKVPGAPLCHGSAASLGTQGSPAARHPWIPGGDTMQEGSLSPADCGDLGLLILPTLVPQHPKGHGGCNMCRFQGPAQLCHCSRTEGNLVLAELVAPGCTGRVRPRGSHAFLGLRAPSGCPLSAALCRQPSRRY